MSEEAPVLEVTDLTMAYGEREIMRGISFTLHTREILAIVGGSGSGKSTLLRHLIGLKKPKKGTIHFGGQNLWEASSEERDELLRRFGILYQGNALWSSLTLAENVAFPLEEFTDLSAAEIEELVEMKLALVGLKGFEAMYPADLSGGMRKRAALARALSLDPEVLFLDEPSAGLDPITSKRLDDLILRVRDGLGTTIVIVTHELPSIFGIASRCLFLDMEEKRVTAIAPPDQLRDDPPSEAIRRFFGRLA
jgi:phospholipid/cholesterol/gamma-HCH transport system ATP-binding protein